MRATRRREGLIRRSVRVDDDSGHWQRGRVEHWQRFEDRDVGWAIVTHFGPVDHSPPRQSAVRVLARAVRDQGGRVEACVSSFDQERKGRSVELRAFYPGDSGYPEPRLLP